MGERFDRNLYRFTYNNPVNFVDPNGLWGIQFGNFNIGWGDPTIAFSGNYGDDVIKPFWGFWAAGNSSVDDETFDELMEDAGAYIHCNSPLRGAYGFAGVQTPKGKTLIPGSHIHGEVLGLAGWDVSDGGWGGVIGAVGYGPGSVGGEYIFGDHGAPIVLGDLSSLPLGGFVTEGKDGLQVGLYMHKSFGKDFGTVGGGFYWDVNKLGNYFKGDYWKGRMPCECE
jgi:hypothetical protein